jgi:hypothetical protein
MMLIRRGFSTEVCILCRWVSEDSQREDSEVCTAGNGRSIGSRAAEGQGIIGWRMKGDAYIYRTCSINYMYVRALTGVM